MFAGVLGKPLPITLFEVLQEEKICSPNFLVIFGLGTNWCW